MIIMKKKFSVILISVIAILLFSIFMILICTRTNNLSIIVLEKHYSLLYEDVPKIEISLYSNHKDSKYMKKSKIENIKIYNDTDLISAKINEIASTSNVIYHQNVSYYENKFTLTLDVISDQTISIQNAKMMIEYDTNEVLDLKLGNIGFLKENTGTSLNIHKVQGIVNDFGMYQSLSAIHVKISSDHDCVIKNISLVSPTVKINYKYLIFGEQLSYDHTTLAKDIFGNSYNSFIDDNSAFSKQQLQKNIQKDVIIPLHYQKKELLDSIGIVIEYTVNDIKYIHTINPYKLFNTNDTDYFIHEYKLS